jgi:hypothetical protein
LSFENLLTAADNPLNMFTLLSRGIDLSKTGPALAVQRIFHYNPGVLSHGTQQITVLTHYSSCDCLKISHLMATGEKDWYGHSFTPLDTQTGKCIVITSLTAPM